MGKVASSRSPNERRALELDSGALLSIVEAAYDIDNPPDTWELEVLRTVARAIGAGLGVFASVHELPSGSLEIDRASVVSLGISDETALAVLEEYSNVASASRSHPHGHGGRAAGFLLTSEITAQPQATCWDELFADGRHGGVNIFATDTNGRGFLMSFAIPADVTMSPATRRDLTRVATQVLAAMRLRRRVGPARENRSRPRSCGPRSLTETERRAVMAAAHGHTTKQIAYTFGIAEVTVRVLLMRAARRCGVQSRKELLNLWSQSH